MQLPHSLESEQQVLGAMMLAAPRVGKDVMAIVSEDSFCHRTHRELFMAIKALWDAGKPCDVAAVIGRLQMSGTLEDAGGPRFVTDVYQSVASPESAKHHAEVVVDRYRLRRLIGTAYQILEIADTAEDATSAIDAAERLIYPIRPQQDSQELSGAATLSGFPSLDAVVGGFRPGNLVVMGALTSMGKTGFGLAISRNVVAGAGGQVSRPVLYVSLEMSAAELATRLMCAEGWVSTARARRGSLTDEDWSRLMIAQESVLEWPLWIEDRRGVTVTEIARIARDLARECRSPLGLVVVDYLGLVGATSTKRNQNREQEVAEISRGLKAMAGELGCPVFALTQFSRAAESDKDGPSLRHFRDSGSIEADADVALLLLGEKISASRTLKIAKNRGGPLGDVEVHFAARYTRMESLVSPAWRPVA